MTSLIQVDEECCAETWWDAARQAKDCPAELRPIVRGRRDTVSARADRVEHLRAWCDGLPGWSDGPDYAPTALLFLDEPPQGDLRDEL